MSREPPASGLHLAFGDGRAPLSELEPIAEALRPIGVGISGLDLGGLPANLKPLLARPTLSDREKERLMAALLLTRERLLAVIAAAGREPHVADGGALSTRVENHGYDYPQLFVVEPGIDYSRFDRYHRNTADDGTAVDEVAQLLHGGGLRVFQRLPGNVEAVLTLDCPGPDRGWIITYGGGRPHIGSVARAKAGTKALVQVIGPARWTMRYEAEES